MAYFGTCTRVPTSCRHSIHSEWVATLDGYVNAEIRPQVSGYIIRQDYKEGAFVRKGDVLFEIDPRPFQAALDHTKADLAQAEAQLGKTRIDVVDDWPEPQVGPGDVLIAMEAIGLCGSDLSVFEGKLPVPSTPCRMTPVRAC